jgi:uncharacterized protein YndB with AHSA1/START domain
MTRAAIVTIDPKLDLVLERDIDIPRELVWKCWTVPEHLMKWFTPAPWQTIACAIDLRPGGIFHTTMRGPEGQEFPNAGCYLEVIENERLVWTTTLGPGFRPSDPVSCGPFHMTGIVQLEPKGRGTKYTAMALHGTEDAAKQHAAMGFEEGWGTALDQLVAHAKTM